MKQVITATNLETIISFINQEKQKGNQFINVINAGEFGNPTVFSQYSHRSIDKDGYPVINSVFGNKIFIEKSFWIKNKKIIRNLCNE